jgi:tetratricopeptide (TPR) repeat protein
VDERARSLAERAARHLATAGRRAMNRSDLAAAQSLLSRAVDLLPAEAPGRWEAQLDLLQVLIEVGEFRRADAAAEELVAHARAVGDAGRELRVRLLNTARSDRTAPWQDVQGLADGAIPTLTRSGDERGLFYAHWVRGAIHWTHGRAGAAEPEILECLRLARRVGLHERIGAISGWLAGMLVWGPTPAREGLRRSEELLREFQANRYGEGSFLITRGVLHAMLGDVEEARTSAERGRAILEDLAPTVFTVMRVASQVGSTEELLGNLDGAEAVMRPALVTLTAMEEKGFLSTLAPQLGRLVAQLGRLDEAEELARLGQEAAPADDWSSQVLWRLAKALALAGRGDLAEAERMAREAVALCEGSDYLPQIGQAWSDLGRVLSLAEKKDQARDALRRALAAFEAKDLMVGAAQVREDLAALG